MAPLEDKARQRYQGLQGQQYHRSKRAIPDVAFPWIARLRAAKLTSSLQAKDVVLEYGVGLGWNLAALPCARKLGYDVGEFLEPIVREQGIEFVKEPERLPDGSVDVVICHHTLEHAWAPPEVLSSIHRLLRLQGQLLLFVPYEKERRYRSFRPAEPNHHLYSWNVQTLANLVQDSGFRVQSAGLGRFGQERFAAVLAMRLKLGERGFRIIQLLANRFKREYEVRVRAVKA
jgi:SAM-dependent methyltransferase